MQRIYTSSDAFIRPVATEGVPTQYPVPEDESVTVHLVRAIATAADVDPADLTPPLYEVVDPEALEALFAPTAGGATRRGRVEFAYDDYRVTVSAGSDGEVTITVAEAETTQADADRERERTQTPPIASRQLADEA